MKLTDSAYAVLCLVEQLQPATAYDLKRLAHSTVFNFWSMPHTVLYTECQRLTEADFLVAEQEDHGRRRRRFSLTDMGREVLDEWRAEPPDSFLELKDPGLLRLFAGADARSLATSQLDRHQAQLRAYTALDHDLTGSEADVTAMRSTLIAGIAIEREYIKIWATLARQGAITSSDLPANDA